MTSPNNTTEAAQPNSQGNSGTESDDMNNELEPLGVQRSLSVPNSRPKGSIKQSVKFYQYRLTQKAGPVSDGSDACLDEDQQLLAVFKLAVWICRCSKKVLSKNEKSVLLLHAINNLNSLTKMTKSVSSLSQVVQMGQGDLLELCLAILCMGDAKLLTGLQTLMASVA